jgi:hypothetical protein
MNERARAFRIGEDEYVFADDRELKAVFDSGSSVVLIPKTLFEPFMTTLQTYVGGEEKMWYQEEGRVYITNDCHNPMKWPSIDILVDEYWLQVHPKDYLLDASEAVDRSSCEIGFM